MVSLLKGNCKSILIFGNFCTRFSFVRFVIFVETRMAFLQKNAEFVESRKPDTRKDVPYHLTFWDK